MGGAAGGRGEGHMGKQITASAVGRLLQCTFPWHETADYTLEESNEAAVYGTAIHSALALTSTPSEVSAETGVPLGDVFRHISAIETATSEFLAGDNAWKIPFLAEAWETSRGIDILAGNADAPPFPFATFLDVETHVYSTPYGMTPVGPIVFGTADLVATAADGATLVLDYKTGQHVEPTAITAQMLTLALLFDADYVAIVHAPRGEPVRIYAERIDHRVMAAFEDRLRAAVVEVASGRIAYSPGKECHYCPARAGCPVQLGSNINAATALVRAVPSSLASEEISLGAMHLLLARLEDITSAAKAKIRAAVLAGEIVERPDGRVLVATTRTKESISKSGILKALGPEKGNALLDELRAAGALTESTYQEVRAK